MKNQLHLYWIDKTWRARGYAKNLHLKINFEDKTYCTYTNSLFVFEEKEDIQAHNKKDILDYVEYLKTLGFNDVKL